MKKDEEVLREGQKQIYSPETGGYTYALQILEESRQLPAFKFRYYLARYRGAKRSKRELVKAPLLEEQETDGANIAKIGSKEAALASSSSSSDSSSSLTTSSSSAEEDDNNPEENPNSELSDGPEELDQPIDPIGNKKVGSKERKRKPDQYPSLVLYTLLNFL
jgi:hypothetical protein